MEREILASSYYIYIYYVYYLAQESNLEYLHKDNENSLFAHDRAIHWLHHQGITLLFKSSSLVYCILGL